MDDTIIDKNLNINSGKLFAYSTGLLQGKSYSRLHSQLTRTLVPLDISVPEWKLLGQIYENSNLKLSELSGLLSYEPPMVTKLVKLLEKKGLLKRNSDKYDERAKIIAITENGRSMIEKAEPLVKASMNEILTGVSREELITYLKVLAVIVHNTEK